MNIFGILLFIGILFFLVYNIICLIKEIKSRKKSKVTMKSESVSNKDKGEE